MTLREAKKQIRSEMRKKRDALQPEQRAEMSVVISRLVCALPEFRQAACVHIFSSFGSEPDTMPIIKAAFDAGKRVFIPVTPAHDMVELRHVEIFPEQQYRPGVFGIPVPHFEDEKEYPYCEPHEFFTGKDCIIVPLLAYDGAKHRLGYGRGFYDRFLARTAGVTIGIAFGFQRVDTLPIDEYDVPLDIIITESI
jgi:5-formyltetrahydrofolate cyclo-ligase